MHSGKGGGSILLVKDRELTDQFARFEQVWTSRDPERAAGVLHEDFALVLVHPAPGLTLRSRWLEMLPDYIVHAWTVLEHRVDVEGDVVSVLQLVDMRATVLGQDRSGLFVITDTWIRGPGGWRIWRRHSTPLSAGPMPD